MPAFGNALPDHLRLPGPQLVCIVQLCYYTFRTLTEGALFGLPFAHIFNKLVVLMLQPYGFKVKVVEPAGVIVQDHVVEDPEIMMVVR